MTLRRLFLPICLLLLSTLSMLAIPRVLAQAQDANARMTDLAKAPAAHAGTGEHSMTKELTDASFFALLALCIMLIGLRTGKGKHIVSKNRRDWDNSRILHSHNNLRPTTFLLRSLAPLPLLLSLTPSLCAQDSNARISGLVTDPAKAVIVGADVVATRVDTNIRYPTRTNGSGVYVLPELPVGDYRVQVEHVGFKTIVEPGIFLHVQDALELNFEMAVGSSSESVTVEASGVNINTTDGSVSTVVDRNFVESIPLNGRSLQPLITLTPGVVLSTATADEQGQFSVNGQRADANYFTVDGVSANFGGSTTPVGLFGQGAGGALPALNAGGGTNSLVSIDAIQEFRVQTSTYAPEFGRMPGGQVSLATRSGTNDFHGDLFDYFRNTVLDANDWFADTNKLPKAPEHQNDFGGVIGGPLVKERTFFFYSYEGLRLLQPETSSAIFPTSAFRASSLVPSGLQPWLDALPVPNGEPVDDGCTVSTSNGPLPCRAQFNAAYSNRTTLDATSLRVDHKLTANVAIFGRYNYATSSALQRIPRSFLASNNHEKFPIQTLTLGSTQGIRGSLSNDFRFNYSRSDIQSDVVLDGFGGATVPLDSALFPSPYSSKNALIALDIIGAGAFEQGYSGGNLQKQFNIVDSLAHVYGKHQFKYGVDYRRLTPTFAPLEYQQQLIFRGLTGPQSIESATVPLFAVSAQQPLGLIFQNFSLYAQDTWRVTPRLSLTYGLRWDVNPPFQGASGKPLYTATNVDDPPNIALAPAGTAFYKTTYGNVAPRLGIALQLSSRSGFERVLRAGAGTFYDLGTGSLSNAVTGWPYTTFNELRNVPFPIPSADEAPLPFSTNLPVTNPIWAADPNLHLPRAYQWNLALEQSLGGKQSVSMTYVGAEGSDLLRQRDIFAPNPNIASVVLTENSSTSDYHSLQIQYQRRLSHGLQALGFYSWSHCIDDASNDSSSFGNDPRLDRGSCDFDIRNSAHGVITFDIPTPRADRFGKWLLGGWAIDTTAVAQSAPPVDLTSGLIFGLQFQNTSARPDVTGEPFYIHGAQYPGGKALNPAAFTNPPVDSDGNPLRQGDLGRNALRGFGLTQVDFAMRRQFNLMEQWRLQFSAEFFNISNHPNFGALDNNLSDYPGTFGQATMSLASSLGSGGFIGGFNPLYQIGGPRSIQLALKLSF